VSDQQPFRTWLIQRLIATRAAEINVPDARIEEYAKQMGVHPDVLFEARALLLIEDAKIGRFFRRHYFQCEVWVPKPIWEVWLEECAFRGIASPVLLRSLLFDYLTHEREPGELLRGWRLGDRSFRVREGDSVKAKTQCTPAAWRVLRKRSMRRGASGSALLRALMMEAIQGEHRAIRLIEARMMHDDESRYYLPP
jgi:hypothetical protein